MDNLIELQESPRTNYTMIPNLVDDADLDPYAFRLYCHLRRVAGEQGACWQSTATLAEACHMSTGQVSQSKKDLAKAGLITITEKPAPGGVQHSITIMDVWQRNAVHTMKTKNPQPSRSEPQRSPREPQRSHSETKNNPLRITNEEVGAQSSESSPPAPSAPTSPGQSRSHSETTPSVDLTPQTDDERALFRLAVMNTAAGRRPPRARFQNAQQANDFRAAVAVLNGETVRILEAFYRNGGGGIGKAVSYVCGAARKRKAEAATAPPPVIYTYAPTSWEET